MKFGVAEILICPACLPEEYPLEKNIHKAHQGDIITGELICKTCDKVYPIQEGIAFLDPQKSEDKMAANRYETHPVVSSYLWSHYGDLLKDVEASDAYVQWGNLMRHHTGYCLDIGSAVGRFSFEMSAKSGFVLGIDNSVAFIRAARELMLSRRKEISLTQEGQITSTAVVDLPATCNPDKVEFLVADAQALPFRSGVFSSLASLNLLDKVPVPLKHLEEMNRVALKQDVEFLCSDPYSWSTEAAKVENWLGGKVSGDFSGHGIENLTALLGKNNGLIRPPWTVTRQGHVWWKIRTHRNHFELIRSCYVLASR